MRAGAFALSLLSVPLNIHALQALKQEPTSLVDLRRTLGSPPQTTMRGHLRSLTEISVVECVRRPVFPVSVDYELTAGGHELLGVSRVLQSWLDQSPDGSLRLGDRGAKSAVKALVGGWSSGIIRALAARPLSLTELSRLIAGLNYPSLERRLAAMRLAGQIEPVPGESRATPYRASAWLRGAIAPLAAGSRWERKRAAADAAPIGRLDVEAAFLLTIPFLRLPVDTSGTCRMAVEVHGSGGAAGLAGVLASVEGGRVVSCVSHLAGPANGWASGPPTAWMEAVAGNDVDALEIGGDADLVRELTDALRSVLLPIGQRS